MDIKDIKGVFVHWTESEYINKVLSFDENGDINKDVDKYAFDSIIKHAAREVGIGFDKTMLTIIMTDGTVHEEIKFYLTTKKDSLIKLIQDNI